MIKNNPNLAFTLAEVLITLGVIGIVAAMTIPVLVQNAEEQKFKSAWKKEYSTLSNAFNAIYAEDGDDYSTSMYPDYTYMKYYFCKVQNRLKVARSGMNCTNESTPTSSGDATFIGWGGDTRKWQLKNGTDMSGIRNSSYDPYVMQLNDGTLIRFDCTWAFWVDVNGYQKPNTVGKDIFYLFKPQGKNKTSFWGTVNQCNAPNDKSISSTNFASDCDSGTGWGCSAKYILNND